MGKSGHIEAHPGLSVAVARGTQKYRSGGTGGREPGPQRPCVVRSDGDTPSWTYRNVMDPLIIELPPWSLQGLANEGSQANANPPTTGFCNPRAFNTWGKHWYRRPYMAHKASDVY